MRISVAPVDETITFRLLAVLYIKENAGYKSKGSVVPDSASKRESDPGRKELVIYWPYGNSGSI